MDLAQDISTIPRLLRNVVNSIHNESDTFLLHKEDDQWKPISYKETLLTADAISAYFLHIGIKKGDRIALIIDNSPEYVFYDQAIQQIGAVNVSIYPTLSEHEIEYILKDSNARTILIGNQFLPRCIITQRHLGQGANQNFQQFRINGMVHINLPAWH